MRWRTRRGRVEFNAPPKLLFPLTPEELMPDRPSPEPDPQDTAAKSETDDDATEPRRFYKGKISAQAGKPIEVSDRHELERPEGLRPEGNAIGDTLRAYGRSARQLIKDRYQMLADFAPLHMRVPCDCWALICDDGIIVRWDRHFGEEEPKVRIAWPQEGGTTIPELAPAFSERFVYCPADISSFVPSPDGQRIQMNKFDSVTGQQTPIAEGQVAIVVNWGAIQNQPVATLTRPVPAVSVVSELEIQIGGEEFDASVEPKPGTGQEFLLTGRLRLPVGWEVFEIYPPFDPELWRPAAAKEWAELDLMAAAARHAVQQQLLENNPELLSPTHLRAWKKVPLGGRITDFVLREPPNDYLLVELEAPTRPLFRKDGQQTEELTHAINQVEDWLRYIQDNLTTVQKELGLTGLSPHPQCLIVIGRSASLSDEDRRKLGTMKGLLPRVRILTYDDLLMAATQSIENLLGSLVNTEGAVEIYYRWDK